MGVPGEGIVSKIPVVGTLSAVTRVRRMVAEWRAIGFDRLRGAVLAERDNALHLLKDVGFRRWAEFWHYGRQLIDLQTRLFFEQIYSDLGKPWSELVTGFGPITDIEISGDVLRRERLARSRQRDRRTSPSKRTQKRRKSYDPATFGGH